MNDDMNIPTLEEIASTDKLRASLGLAIAEARMVRSLLKKKAPAVDTDDVQKLGELDREIDYLETTLFELKSKGSQ